MPAKSRRNRRNIPQNRKMATAPSVPRATPETFESAPKLEKTLASSRLDPKAVADPAITYPYIMSEIKWISIVTGIVAVVLIIFYIFFH